MDRWMDEIQAGEPRVSSLRSISTKLVHLKGRKNSFGEEEVRGYILFH